MKDFKVILFILSFTLMLALTSRAYAYIPLRGNVHATLGPYIFQTNYNGDEAMTSPNTNGVAVMLLGDVNEHGSLEIATIHMNKMYFRKDNGRLIVEKVPTIHVSMGYRHWYNRKLSASLALFTSYPLEEADVIHNEFPAGQQIPTTARENSETGLDLGMEAELWSEGRYAVFMGGRYSWSLTKKSDESADQYGVLLGVRYFIQAKDAPAQ